MKIATLLSFHVINYVNTLSNCQYVCTLNIWEWWYMILIWISGVSVQTSWHHNGESYHPTYSIGNSWTNYRPYLFELEKCWLPLVGGDKNIMPSVLGYMPTEWYDVVANSGLIKNMWKLITGAAPCSIQKLKYVFSKNRLMKFICALSALSNLLRYLKELLILFWRQTLIHLQRILLVCNGIIVLHATRKPFHVARHCWKKLYSII